MSRLWRQDLAWAGLILGVALLLGLMQQWELVHRSWRGELAAAPGAGAGSAPAATNSRE